MKLCQKICYQTFDINILNLQTENKILYDIKLQKKDRRDKGVATRLWADHWFKRVID